MSKYDPLFHHLSHSKGAVDLSFDDIEGVLGFALPNSARQYAAWWSNSGGTHVQAAAWLGAGYRTEDVSVKQRTVRFVPNRAGGFGEMKQSSFDVPSGDTKNQTADSKAPFRHPAWGALKGMITLRADQDYTAPAYADWKKLYGEER